MTNAEKFEKVFGLYATELWAMSEKNFLEWLNSDVPDTNVGDITDKSAQNVQDGDLISRKQAIEEISRQQTYKMFAGEDTVYLDANDVGSVLASMPSAQPEPITLESAIDYLHSIGWMQKHDRILTETAQPERKPGRWIPHEDEDGAHYGDRCSECGEWYVMPYGKVNFCPNCGADMRTSK